MNSLKEQVSRHDLGITALFKQITLGCYVSVNSKPDYPPPPRRNFLEKANSPPPGNKGSAKPQPLGQKNRAKTPPPGQLFSKIQQEKTQNMRQK